MDVSTGFEGHVRENEDQHSAIPYLGSYRNLPDHENEANPGADHEENMSAQTVPLQPSMRANNNFGSVLKAYHESNHFKFGRVFSVLWSAPFAAESVAKISSVTKVNRSQIRRFIVIKQHEGYCNCLPITTYSGQGTQKKGMSAGHHGLIYSSTSRRDDRSYTVKHNAKVRIMGEVGREGVEKHGPDRFGVLRYPRRNLDIQPGSEPQNKVCENCAGLLYRSDENRTNLCAFRMLNHSPKTLGVTNLVSAAAMGGTYVWLNHTSGPKIHSNAFRWIIGKAGENTPDFSLRGSNVPGWAIFALFATSTVLFTGTTFLWAANRVQTATSKTLAVLVTTIAVASFMLAGFGAEEIVLAGLPLSISIGILISCLTGGQSGKDSAHLETNMLVLDV